MTALSRIEWICRLSLAALWAYQGLVPKLLGPHPQELALAASAGLPGGVLDMASWISGAAELILASTLLVFRQSAWPYVGSALALVGLFVFVVWVVPEHLNTPFNAVAVNGAWTALTVVGYLVSRASRRT